MAQCNRARIVIFLLDPCKSASARGRALRLPTKAAAQDELREGRKWRPFQAWVSPPRARRACPDPPRNGEGDHPEHGGGAPSALEIAGRGDDRACPSTPRCARGRPPRAGEELRARERRKSNNRTPLGRKVCPTRDRSETLAPAHCNRRSPACPAGSRAPLWAAGAACVSSTCILRNLAGPGSRCQACVPCAGTAFWADLCLTFAGSRLAPKPRRQPARGLSD